MKIAVLGTGVVGRALTAGLARQGHQVVMGTRDVAATLERDEPDGMGNPPYREWRNDHPDVDLATFAEAAAGGEIVVNATSGAVILDALRRAGEEHLAGKVLLDVANPLDFSAGMPPTLLVKDTDSLGEQVQRAFPRARVVKALNTMNAVMMVDPGQLAGGDHTVFLAGNDAEAKAQVSDLLRGWGWTDIIDLGDISGSRGAEMLLPIWLRLMGALGTPAFNFKIVR